jgi:hypothetical protein
MKEVCENVEARFNDTFLVRPHRAESMRTRIGSLYIDPARSLLTRTTVHSTVDQMVTTGGGPPPGSAYNTAPTEGGRRAFVSFDQRLHRPRIVMFKHILANADACLVPQKSKPALSDSRQANKIVEKATQPHSHGQRLISRYKTTWPPETNLSLPNLRFSS